MDQVKHAKPKAISDFRPIHRRCGFDSVCGDKRVGKAFAGKHVSCWQGPQRPPLCRASDRSPAVHSTGRSAQADAARTRLAQSQAPRAHRHLAAAVAPANPQTVAGVPIRRELAEYLAAPQRSRTRPGPPHATLLTAAAVPRSATLHRIQRGAQVVPAPALPQPYARAAILKRD